MEQSLPRTTSPLLRTRPSASSLFLLALLLLSLADALRPPAPFSPTILMEAKPVLEYLLLTPSISADLAEETALTPLQLGIARRIARLEAAQLRRLEQESLPIITDPLERAEPAERAGGPQQLGGSVARAAQQSLLVRPEPRLVYPVPPGDPRPGGDLPDLDAACGGGPARAGHQLDVLLRAAPGAGNRNNPRHLFKWFDIFAEAHGAAFDLHGWSYFRREGYDSFYPDYGEGWPMLTGAVGMLFESASPAGGGVRRNDGTLRTLKQAAWEHYSAEWATVRTSAARRAELVADYAKARQDAIRIHAAGPMRAVVFERDGQGRADSLARLLRANGIVVQQLAGDATLPSTGRRFSSGATSARYWRP